MNNSVLATKENYVLNSTYTVIIETKNIMRDVESGFGFMISTGRGAAGIGGSALGICKNEDYYAMSGAGDGYNLLCSSLHYTQNQWHISAIKYDGAYWGYANGYYRNLAIYDGALTDQQLTNYSF